jgi:hypothetical protein
LTWDPDRGRFLAWRWFKTSAALSFGFHSLLIPVGLANLESGVTTTVTQIAFGVFVIPLFVIGTISPLIWVWPFGSEAFRAFDSWWVFILSVVALFLFSLIILIPIMVALAPPTLGGGMGGGIAGVLYSLEAATVYVLPRSVRPSLWPGEFRKTCYSQ